MNIPGQVRRPLIGIALAVAAGLWLERQFLLDPGCLLAALAFLLAGLLWRANAPLFYAACLLSAAAWGGIFAARSTSVAAGWPPQALVGRVLDDPTEQGERYAFLFRSEAVCVDGEWIEDRCVIRVYSREAEPGFFAPGRRLVLHGTSSLYSRPRNGVAGWMSLPRADDCAILPGGKPMFRPLQPLRENAARLLVSGTSPDSLQSAILSALLLGYRQSLPVSLRDRFARTGTLHVFAISGLHVGVMASIFIAVLKRSGIQRRLWGLLLIPALLVYTASTGMKPSAMRAFTMAAVYFTAPLLNRKPDVPSAVALAAILLLMFQPHQIAEPGFVFSFMVVSGIILFHGSIARLLCADHDDESASPRGYLAHQIRVLAITSLAAWIFSMPLTARYFNLISPIALVGNLFVIPLTFLIVLTGCLTILSGILLPVSAVLFQNANAVLITVLIGGIRAGEALPGSWFVVAAPPLSTLFLWYGGWIFLLAGPLRLRAAGLAALLGAGCLWIAATQAPEPGTLRVYTQGRSAVALRLPENQWVLLSDGSAREMDRTIRRLRQLGVNRLSSLIVSPDADPLQVRHLEQLFRPRETHTTGDGFCWGLQAGRLCTGSDPAWD